MFNVTPSAEEITQGSLRVVPTGGVQVSKLVGMLAEQSVQAQVGLGEEEEEAFYEKK